ncbi:MAG: geranylgeranylglycerol-phosphate geranylgeranyltransferase [Candidatus Aenigmarchaeota archaeon]|nr:geranylgeranylglycerol-phosphate geranylgeranyltransferase [Candidatus Aenigmarchaeota archaeon]
MDDNEGANYPKLMIAYLQLIRPLNCFMAAFAVYTATLVAGLPLLPPAAVLLGMLSVFLVCAGGMAVNDYFDIAIDRINRPKRPLAAGTIQPRHALIYASALFASGAALSYIISIVAFSLALFAALLLLAYAWRLKKLLLVGHLAVSLLVALTFVYGGALAGAYEATLYLALLAFLSSIGREIFKSIEDALGDTSIGVESLAIRYGAQRARAFASVPLMLAVVLSFIPFLNGMFGTTYLYFVSIADLMFLGAMAAPLRFSSKLCKAAMAVALLAFLAGAVTA